MKLVSDHGVTVRAYVNPDDMDGLDLESSPGIQAGYLTGNNFYFENSEPPGPPPAWGQEWWRWAQEHGGKDVYASHVLLVLQATQDRAVMVSVPKVERAVTATPQGIICGPEGQGGNGLLVRRFYIDLDEPDPVRARFINDLGVEGPRFTMNKGETVAIVAIAEASSGLHEWKLQIPMTIDGQDFLVGVDNGGQPFVTVGPGEIPMLIGVAEEGRWQRTGS